MEYHEFNLRFEQRECLGGRDGPDRLFQAYHLLRPVCEFSSIPLYMKLIVTVAATGSYCYAMKTLVRRIAACLSAANWKEPGRAIIAGDNTKEVREAVKQWKATLPENWAVDHIIVANEDLAEPNYKEGAQKLIAKLRSAAFSEARRHDPDFCWSLDSDTLPPANALRCMLDMLRFDGGYYSVSTCPYPNEAFLGGRGTPQNPIGEDFLDFERVLPDDLKAEIEALNKEAAESKERQPSKEWLERKQKADEAMRKCPPDGNIWQVIAKHGWRARGWLDNAYPGIGKGAVLQSDWCGFGCTLMNREALALANFEGYNGQGTEDLYVVWKRWYPAGLRINAITHCPCDHVIWSKKKGGAADEYTLIQSYHEGAGECVGHLRTQKTSWCEF